MRQLASIQKVLKIEPIERADSIEKLTVLGWELVAKKGDFKEGDLCVYIEIDSIVPETAWSEFLRPRKFKVRTIKLRGQVSQGLALPLSVLPNSDRPMKWGYQEGKDVTEILSIKKYDPQGDKERLILEQKHFLFNKKIDNYLKRYSWFRKLVLRPSRDKFPSFIKKTDEDRIQLFPNICEKHQATKFVCTEKLDGSSCTYFVTKNTNKWQFWKPYIFGVCSRNLRLYNKNNNWYQVAIKLDIEKKLISHAKAFGFKTVVIQGELIGEGIQGNKYQLKGHDFYLFNLIEDGHIKGISMQSDFSARYDVKLCPVLNDNYYLASTIHDEVLRASGKSLIGSKPTREGVVIRNYFNNISFKVINPDFLLKYEE